MDLLLAGVWRQVEAAPSRLLEGQIVLVHQQMIEELGGLVRLATGRWIRRRIQEPATEAQLLALA